MKIKQFFKSIFSNGKLSVLVDKTEPETESELFFSNAMKSDDFNAMISFIENGYELTSTQKEFVLEQVLETISNKVKPKNTEQSYRESLDIYNKGDPSLKEIFYLGISYKSNMIDDELCQNLLSPPYIHAVESIISKNAFKSYELSKANNKKDLLDVISKYYISHFKDRIKSNTEDIERVSASPDSKLLEYYSTFLKNNMKELESLNKGTFISSLISFSSKYDIFFPTMENFTSYEKIRKTNFGDDTYTRAYTLDKVKAPFLTESISYYNDTLEDYIKNIFIRSSMTHKKVDHLASLALSNDSPMTFAYLVNLSSKSEVLEKYQSTPDEMLKLQEACDKLSKKNSTTLSFSRHYQNIGKTAQIIHDDLSDVHEKILAEKQQKQKQLELSIALMKKEKEIKKRSQMSTIELINEMSINQTIKSKFINILDISKEILEIPEINLEERNFCTSIDRNILNLLHLQFAFNDSPLETAKFNNSLNEQANQLFKILDDIREEHKQQALANINEQVEQLLNHQQSKKHLLR